MNTFFTSDTHWGHESIIRLCNRPFVTVHEMNETMIHRWNSVVEAKDVVYHLGDAAFRDKGIFSEIFKRLNGVKHLIRGNHDNNEVLHQPWASVSEYKEIKMDGKHIVLFHYPMRSWNRMYHGALHFYGHEHGNIFDYSNCMDVGVDSWDFYPITLQQILERATTLTPWDVRHRKDGGTA